MTATTCAASPHAPLTRSAVRLYSTCHTPLRISKGLCNMLTPPRQAQPLPTTHASPLPVSPAGQPLGTMAKPCPPGHATTLCSCMTVLAVCASALTRHRQPPPHNFTAHTDPTRHLIHTDHMKPTCCSLLQALCFPLVLMLFNNSLCFHFSHLMLSIYTVPQIRLSDLQRQKAWCQRIYDASFSD